MGRIIPRGFQGIIFVGRALDLGLVGLDTSQFSTLNLLKLVVKAILARHETMMSLKH